MKKPLHYIRTTSVAKLLESLPFSTPTNQRDVWPTVMGPCWTEDAMSSAGGRPS